MLQDNPLLAQLKQQLHQQTPRTEGTVKAHDKGFGFLELDNKKSYFIPAHKMNKVMHGDKVSGIIVTSNDKESFEPETIIEPGLSEFLGQITFANKAMEIIPENQTKFSIRCKVSPLVETRLKAGDWVKAKLTTHALEEGKNHFFAEITQFVSEEHNPLLLWMLTLARYNLESTPCEDRQFERLTDSSQRTDLTNTEFFTIDSKETLDMDDAIAISRDDNGQYLLSVAIADPSAFIEENSDIDQYALKRCFTTYLPNFTVPMLPKSLANELCSLKANEKRPALVCQLTVSSNGDIDYKDAKFTQAWITSKAKLAYNEVSDFIEKALPINSISVDLTTPLTLLSELAQVRVKWRQDNALLFKDSNEYRFVFDEHRNPINIIKESRRIAHKMVEEVMVIANQVLTHQLQHKLGFGIFNVHNGLDQKFLEPAVKLLHENNLEQFDKDNISSFDGYKMLRKAVEDKPLLEYRLRRFQSPAEFSIEPKPHFGLGFEAYATWTSPIRKYGDLFNHRLVKTLLCNSVHEQPKQEILEIMSERRKTLRFAERDIADKLYCQFLANKIGECYQAEIIDINRGGARVRLTEIGAVAFMPLSLIHSNNNEVVPFADEGLIKIRDEVAYQLLDQIEVIINEVKLSTTNIIVKLA